MAHADVVIHDGRIARIGRHLGVPADAREIDGRGRFLIPGLIDSHVHVGHSAALTDDEVDRHPDIWAAYRAQVPRAYLAFGFTTIVDLDLTPRSQAWFEATPLHPRFRHCSQGVKVAGGYGAQFPPPPTAPNFPNLVYEPTAAKSWPKSLDPSDYTPARAVERVAAAGATCLKVFVEPGFGVFNWPVPQAPTLAGLRQAASQRGLVMFTHATGLEGWRAALDAHTDVIAHGIWVWPGNTMDREPPAAVREAIFQAARTRTYVQPTLQVIAGERAMFDPEAKVLDDPRLAFALPRRVLAFLRTDEAKADGRALAAQYEKAAPPPGMGPQLESIIARAQATYRLMLKAGVPLILGSDTPAGDGFGNPPGLNGRFEMQDWADAGASPRAILRAATIENARALGLARELGSVEVGKRADLLLLGRNPLVDVTAYDALQTVILNGQPIDREALRPPD
jgi:imidazolonepropionase-like amidohydrolase